MAVHRIIEEHAARCGDTTAITHSGITLSYRELNQRANAVARHLVDHDFRRGMLAWVDMPRTAETAVILLAILKAGGRYALAGAEVSASRWPSGLSFEVERDGDETRYRTLDVSPSFVRTPQSSANLPILVRDSDIACAIPEDVGSPMLLVPHATIVSLRPKTTPPLTEWSGEAGALDLWAALMSGGTVTLSGAALRSAA